STAAFAAPPAKKPTTTCVATAGSLFALSAMPLGGTTPRSLCDQKGNVLLIVNAAALDGYTPQWAGLQSLETKFAGQRFHVLAFFSDDFGAQGGTSAEIASADAKYAVTYAQFAKDHV